MNTSVWLKRTLDWVSLIVSVAVPLRSTTSVGQKKAKPDRVYKLFEHCNESGVPPLLSAGWLSHPLTASTSPLGILTARLKVASTEHGAVHDDLTGTAGRDVIAGKGGNDVINGLGGDDLVCGGRGRDKLFGQGGADKLRGGRGGDWILAGAGDDLLHGDRAPISPTDREETTQFMVALAATVSVTRPARMSSVEDVAEMPSSWATTPGMMSSTEERAGMNFSSRVLEGR